MTRTSHHAHATPNFPIYCLDWADDDVLIVGGGGGPSRTGLDNKLKTCRVSKDGREVKYLSEIRLSSDEDAPMTLAVDRNTRRLVTGINSSQKSIEDGQNEHCRIYSYDDKEFKYEKGKGTINAKWSEDYPYQKLTTVSPGRDMVAIGTTDNNFSILDVPSLNVLVEPINMEDELVDIDWGGPSGEWLAVTTTKALYLYNITKDEKIHLILKQTIYPPSLDINTVAFRAARFSKSSSTSSSPIIHAVLNASKVTKRGAPRKSFVVNFALVAGPGHAPVTEAEEESKGKEKESDAVDEGKELGRWDVIARREVASRPITVFDVSHDGRLLAYGGADLSIGILDSRTLAPLLKILHAHSFPATALRFNPSVSLLVSASADHSMRAIVVPANFDGLSPSMFILFLALLILIIAIMLRR